CQRVNEQVTRLLATTKRPPGVDEPKPANQESRSRQAEVVRRSITHNVLFTQKFALHRLDGTDEARIVGLDHAEVRQQQNACIEIIRAEGGGESLPLVVPGSLQESLMHRLRNGLPMSVAVRQAQSAGDRGESVTA